MKDNIIKLIKDAGAVAVGFSAAGKINDSEITQYEAWIKRGFHAGMEYLDRNRHLRVNTDNVLKGGKTIISMAFSYMPLKWREKSLPAIAAYAYGKDYHEVIRKRLEPVVQQFKKEYGGEWRICIDTAPLAERYFALKSGIGKLTKSGNVEIKNYGTACFLAEIITTVSIEPDNPRDLFAGKCVKCNICKENCPGKAINENGVIDARRCVSYLTIEKKGELEEEDKIILQHDKIYRGFLYGCDLCVRLCPYNRDVEANDIEEFKPDEHILSLGKKEVIELDNENFATLFRKSAIRRAKLDGLQRNARNLP